MPFTLLVLSLFPQGLLLLYSFSPSSARLPHTVVPYIPTSHTAAHTVSSDSLLGPLQVGLTCHICSSWKHPPGSYVPLLFNWGHPETVNLVRAGMCCFYLQPASQNPSQAWHRPGTSLVFASGGHLCNDLMVTPERAPTSRKSDT